MRKCSTIIIEYLNTAKVNNVTKIVKSTQRASNQRTREKTYLSKWWAHVRAAIGFSLKRLWFNPLSTWITLAAIAIALSLPTGLHLFLKNLQTLTDDQRQIPTISLFLKDVVTEQKAKDIASLITELNEVDKVIFESKDNAFKKFGEITGFGDTLKTLDHNPLPHVLVVTPNLTLSGEMDETIKELTAKLKNYSEVDSVQADIEWVQRLRAIILIAQRILTVVGS